MKRVVIAAFLAWAVSGGAAPEAGAPAAASGPPVECRATFVIG